MQRRQKVPCSGLKAWRVICLFYCLLNVIQVTLKLIRNVNDQPQRHFASQAKIQSLHIIIQKGN